MSLDHESRPTTETVQNPSPNRRKRNRIIASVAGGTALLAAIGAGVGLSQGGGPESQPNHPTSSGKATPGSETSPSTTPSAPETQASSEAVTLSSEATPFGRSSELNSQADQDNFVAKFYSPFTPDALRNLANPNELDNLEYHDAAIAPFISQHQLSNHGIDGIYGLNDAVATVSDTLSRPMKFSDPEQAQQWFGDKLDPADNLTASSWEQASRHKDVKALYEQLSNLSKDNYSKAQSLFLSELIDIAKQGVGSPDNDKFVSKIFDLQNQYSKLATLGYTGDLAASQDDEFKQWSTDTMNTLFSKHAVDKLTKEKTDLDQSIANPSVKLDKVEILNSIDAANVTNGSGNVAFNSYEGAVVEIPFLATYVNQEDGSKTKEIINIVAMPDPVNGAADNKATVGLMQSAYVLNQ